MGQQPLQLLQLNQARVMNQSHRAAHLGAREVRFIHILVYSPCLTCLTPLGGLVPDPLYQVAGSGSSSFLMKQNLLACHPCHIPVLQERGVQLVPASVGGEQALRGKGTVSLSHSFGCSGFSWRGLWFCMSFVKDQSQNGLD